MGKSLIITTGGGTDVEDGNPNATEAQVLSGYTFFAWQDEPRTGTMPTHWPSYTHNMEPGWHLDLPWGYYTGGLVCKGLPLQNFTSATATKGTVLDTKTGWASGEKITGTMANKGKTIGTLSANGTYTVPAGWHNGQGSVNQSLGTQAATNVTPGTAQKTVIAASKWTTGAQTVLGNGNLVAGNIKKNVSIFGVKGTFAVDPSAVFVNGQSVTGGNVVAACAMVVGATSSSNSGWSSRMKTYWTQYCRFPPVIEGGALRLFCWHADGTDNRWCLGTLGEGYLADGGIDKYNNPSYVYKNGRFGIRPNLSGMTTSKKIEVKIEYLKWATSLGDGDRIGGFYPYIGIGFVRSDSPNRISDLVSISGYNKYKMSFAGGVFTAADVQAQNTPFTMTLTSWALNANCINEYNTYGTPGAFWLRLGHHILHKFKSNGNTPASGVFDNWFWIKNIYVRLV